MTDNEPNGITLILFKQKKSLMNHSGCWLYYRALRQLKYMLATKCNIYRPFCNDLVVLSDALYHREAFRYLTQLNGLCNLA